MIPFYDEDFNKISSRNERLRKLYDSAFKQPLLLVRAISGYGKTASMRGYLEESKFDTIYLTCTSFDNEIEKFWDDLCEAFGTYNASLKKSMKKNGFPEEEKEKREFFHMISDELGRSKNQAAVVFDEFHLIENPEIKNLILEIINGKLNNISIILTRDWKVFDEEIRVAYSSIDRLELKCTFEEGRELLKGTGYAISEEEIKEIYEYVDGWPAALIQVAKIMKIEGDTSNNASIMSRAKPRLLALYETAIFSQYSKAEQEFIGGISVLGSFQRGIVQKIGKSHNRDLADIIHGNPFIQLNEERSRFYFMPYSREYLLEYRIGLSPDKQKKSLIAAALWCEEKTYYFDAIRYYKNADNYRGVYKVLNHLKGRRYSIEEGDFLLESIKWMPKDFQQEHPFLSIMSITLLVNNLRFAEAERIILMIEKEIEQWEDPSLVGEFYVAKGLKALFIGEDDFKESFRKAANLLPLGSHYWDKNIYLVYLGPCIHLQSKEKGALIRSLECYKKGSADIVQVLNGAGQGIDILATSEVAFLQGDVKTALEYGYQALYLAEAVSEWDIVGNALLLILRCYIIIGDYNNILDTLEHVERYKNKEGPKELAIWDIIEGWYNSEVEEEKEIPWARNAIHNGYPPISIERPSLVRLKYLMSTKQFPEGFALTEQLERLAALKNSVLLQIYVTISKTIILYATGKKEEAVKSLEEAYNLSAPNNIIAPFVEQGNHLRALIIYSLDKKEIKIPKLWLKAINAKANTFAKKRAYLIERHREDKGEVKSDFSLSHREKEVLQNLSQGLTQEEIGLELYLSSSTVKSILKQIYTKLGAINSADAVRIAMKNGIIA